MNSATVRQRNLGGGVQHVLDYLKRMQAENPAFFYATQGDNSCSNIFWADANSRTNYSYFGDTVRLDTAYRNNSYKVPFVTFTGLNHHAQPALFGCALLFNESDASYVWLFQVWLRAMSARSPISITTDANRLIQMAVARVLPDTRHRLCKWSIFREAQEKLAHIYQMRPDFEFDFMKCISEAETVEEFELHWKLLLQRYNPLDNEWLQSMYKARHQWIPVYTHDTFFGEISSDESSKGMNLFFHAFVDASTTIQSLIRQYEKAITSWQDKEVKADYDTTNTAPVLKTPSPMEKQAANLYTRRIFMKFQEELVETLANPATKVDDSGTVAAYQVAKFGEEHKAHSVKFDACKMIANCTCQMFEFSGIICRHVLSVFRAKNVLNLPPQYVLKRWTINAKSIDGSIVDQQVLELPSSGEFLSIRYNNLRQEALKFVEEGAKSIHCYHVAMDALQEASQKVSLSKKKSSNYTQYRTLANGYNEELQMDEQNQAASGQSMDKEMKIRELTAELDSINQRSEVYRANLLAVLKDIEEQKLKLSVKVQNARLSLKE